MRLCGPQVACRLRRVLLHLECSWNLQPVEISNDPQWSSSLMNSLVYLNVRSSASARNLNHSEYSPGALSKSLTFLKHTETISFCNSRRSSEPVSLQLGAGIQPPHCTATNKGFPLKADVVCSDTSNEFYCSWRSVSVPLLDTTRTYLRPNLCAACFDQTSRKTQPLHLPMDGPIIELDQR